MPGQNAEDVTLNTLHGDLADLKGGLVDLKQDVRAGFADLKTTLVAGFRSLPTRESSEEMVRLLREANRLHEERFAQLDLRIREQHLELQQILRGIAEGTRALLEGQQALHEDIRALITRLDALIKGRGDGAPTS